MKHVNLHRIIFCAGVAKAAVIFAVLDFIAAFIAIHDDPGGKWWGAFAILGVFCCLCGIGASLFPRFAERRDFRRSIRGDGYLDPL